MRRLLALAPVVLVLLAPALANSAPGARSCTDPALAAADRAGVELAQSDCRGNCSSSRGYCLSTCRDSFCRAVCNDRYQSCLSSCRR